MTGYYFGTFDPIHIGHLNVINSILMSGYIDKLEIIPAYQNPHKCKPMFSFDDRVEMIDLATEIFDNVVINTIEEEINEPYTYNILQELEKGYIITTYETYIDIKNWYKGNHILKDWEFIIMYDTSVDLIDPELMFAENIFKYVQMVPIPFHSTYIRKRIQEKENIYPLVPIEVKNYIYEKFPYNY